MFQTKSNISRIIVSFGLLMVFLYPSVIQMVHTIDCDHQTELVLANDNIQDADLDCDICDFSFTSFDFETERELLIGNFVLIQKEAIASFSFLRAFDQRTALPLRGPPSFLL
ncbi:MAG: hypothetical protein OIF50_11735 [Flavobacteriaceae bacterium]|nr:hypothetical protein [Flavobacteriaceae bacterium]